MELIETDLYNQTGGKIGVILSVISHINTNFNLKPLQEAELRTYAQNVLYPDIPLSVYIIESPDMASITVFPDINALPSTTIKI